MIRGDVHPRMKLIVGLKLGGIELIVPGVTVAIGSRGRPGTGPAYGSGDLDLDIAGSRS
ncbi:hypothetical protein D3C86_2057390 [compost metagenome]